MAGFLTLADVKKTNGGSPVNLMVIDEFAKSNHTMNHLLWTPAAAETGIGGAFTYTYNRQTTQAMADFRAVNADYTPSVTDVAPVTVQCAIFGGAFDVDRVVAAMGPDRVAREINQKVKAASALFNDTLFNGDTGANALAFDGLDTILQRDGRELDGVVDLTAADKAAVLDVLDSLADSLDSTEGAAFYMDTRAYQIVRRAVRESGLLDTSKDQYDRQVESFRGMALVNPGEKAGSSERVIGTTAGLTSIYAVRFGEDGLHGVTPANRQMIETYVPDFKNGDGTPVRRGAVEMVATVALQATKAAAVHHGIRVAAAV